MKPAPRLNIIVLCLLLNACAAVAPGNDPIVVNAERDTAIAADAFDTFLKTYAEIRGPLRASSPTVYAPVARFADFLREPVIYDNGTDMHTVYMPRAKGWLKSARVMTMAYKTHRSAENKANLVTIMATINAAVMESRNFLAQASAVKIKP